jgi:hypothetical protein
MNKTKKRISAQKQKMDELENRVEELEQELEDKNSKIEKTNLFKASLKEFLDVEKEDEDFITRDDVKDMIDEELDNLSIDSDITICR